MGLKERLRSLTPAAREEARQAQADRREAVARRDALSRLTQSPPLRSYRPRLLAAAYDPLNRAEIMQQEAIVRSATADDYALKVIPAGDLLLEELGRLGGGQRSAAELYALKESLWPSLGVLDDPTLNASEFARIHGVVLALLDEVKSLRGFSWKEEIAADGQTYLVDKSNGFKVWFGPPIAAALKAAGRPNLSPERQRLAEQVVREARDKLQQPDELGPEL